jgi:REP element-mobilizing transposase RayT
MARPLRIQAPGLTYHVMARGNAGRAIYRDDEDRTQFLEVLGACAAVHRLICHAYCQMDTHYHVVLTTAEANLSKAIHDVNGTYATWWNRRHKRVGHVFQGRFRAQIVQEEGYLLEVCRYVALNPVRARLVARPEAWRWSSYRATTGMAARPDFLVTDFLLSHFGALEGSAGDRYRSYVEAAVVKPVRMPRRGAPVIGDAEFVRRFRSKLRQPLRSVPLQPRWEDRPSLAQLFDGAAAKRERNARTILAFRVHRYSMRELARFLELDPSTISRIVGGKGSGDARSRIQGSDP